MAKRKRVLFGPPPWILVVLFALLAGIIVTMLAASRTTEIRQFARGSKCSLDGCNQCQDNATNWWLLYDSACNDIQQCDRANRIGYCGSQVYCCNSAGGQWSVGPCGAGGTYYGDCHTNPTPTPTPTATPTPTPTPTPEPTDTPMPTPTPYIYYEPVTPTPTKTPTPTPTSYILASCNKACSSNADCPGGLTCVTAFGQNVCRNPLCSDQFSCLCGQGSFANLVLTPTPAEGGLTSTGAVVITVSSFTDSNGVASNVPTLTGLTEPGALVTISIFPDGVTGTVTADASGRWSWRSTKTLTPGQKSLLIVAKNAQGAQGQVNQTFTVAAAKGGNPWGVLILILVVVGVGFGGYVYYKSNNP